MALLWFYWELFSLHNIFYSKIVRVKNDLVTFSYLYSYEYLVVTVFYKGTGLSRFWKHPAYFQLFINVTNSFTSQLHQCSETKGTPYLKFGSEHILWIIYKILNKSIVRKRIPVPPFKALISWPSLPPVFKIFVSPHLFSVPLPFQVFQTVPPSSCNPPTLIGPINLPYTWLTSLNKYQKGDFTSLTVAFDQKSIFTF